MTGKKQTTKGLNSIRDQYKDHVTDMAIGTGTTDPTKADTALGNEVLEKSATTSTLGEGAVRSEMRVLTSEANGQTLTEVGDKDNAGDLENRITHGGIAKDSSFELIYRITKTVQNT